MTRVAAAARAWIAAVLAAVVGLATLDQGGAGPTGMVLWHGLLWVALVGWLVSARGATSGYGAGRAVTTALAAFCAVALVGAARAPYAFAAWLFLVELAAFCALVGLSAGCGPAMFGLLRPVLWLVAVLQSFVLLAQKLVSASERPAASFVNPNHLAGWLVAAALCLASGLLTSSSRGRRMGLAAGLVPVLAAVAVTGSRGAVLGLVAGLAMLLVLARDRLTPAMRRAAVALTVVAVAVAGVGLAHRLSRPDPFRYQRLKIWRASSRVVLDEPWFGSGPRQFAAASRALQFPDGDGPLRYDRGFATTHSDLLRVPCELGWPGALAALALLLAVGRAGTRRDPGGALEADRIAAAAALTALAAQATVDNLSHSPATYVLAAVLVGVAVSRPTQRQDQRLGHRGLAAIPLAVLFAVGDVGPYLAWAEVKALPRGRLEERGVARLDRALRLNRLQPDYWLRRAEHLAGQGHGWDLDRYALAREAAEHALRLNSRSAELHLGLARVEALAARTLFGNDGATIARADRAYAGAERLEPFNPHVPLERAAFLLDAGDAEGAARAAERVLTLEPEAATPRLVLAGATLAHGTDDADAAEAWLQQARDQADKWSQWAGTSSYARALLRLDPRLVARVTDQLAQARRSAPRRG